MRAGLRARGREKKKSESERKREGESERKREGESERKREEGKSESGQIKGGREEDRDSKITEDRDSERKEDRERKRERIEKQVDMESLSALKSRHSFAPLPLSRARQQRFPSLTVSFIRGSLSYIISTLYVIPPLTFCYSFHCFRPFRSFQFFSVLS